MGNSPDWLKPRLRRVQRRGGSMMDREALAQVEQVIDDCNNRIGRQRETVASAFQEGRDPT
jgi:hypothetical protein